MTRHTIVRCPRCRAAAGTDCTTKSGNPPRMPHQARWDALRTALRSRPAVYRLREDDPQFHLSAGDLLLCTPYPYDSKQTVLRRLSDGYDPSCNQYNSSLEFVAFADEYNLEADIVAEAARYLNQSRADYASSAMRLLTGAFA